MAEREYRPRLLARRASVALTDEDRAIFESLSIYSRVSSLDALRGDRADSERVFALVDDSKRVSHRGEKEEKTDRNDRLRDGPV